MTRRGASPTVYRFAVVLAIVLGATPYLFADDSDERRALEGVWDVAVTVRDCQTGAVVRLVSASNMFMRGGTLTEMNKRLSPASRSVSYGTWRPAGDHRFTSVFRFSRFNPADGTFLGTQTVTRKITVSSDGNTFAANTVSEMFDATNQVIRRDCATEMATRLE